MRLPIRLWIRIYVKASPYKNINNLYVSLSANNINRR